jgi:hypothetical protein
MLGQAAKALEANVAVASEAARVVHFMADLLERDEFGGEGVAGGEMSGKRGASPSLKVSQLIARSSKFIAYY